MGKIGNFRYYTAHLMKPFILFFLFIISIYSTSAQSSKKGTEGRYNHKAFISILLRNNQNSVAAKTTIARERVIAQSIHGTSAYFLPIDSLTDSVKIAYTGSRNSSYDYNTMAYFYNYPYSNTPMFDFMGTFTKPQVLYDTLWHWTLAPNLTTHLLGYGFYESGICSYNTGNNLISYYHSYVDSANMQNTSYVNSFNITGTIGTGYWFNSVAGSPDSAYKQLFSYNSGKLSEDSIYIKRSGGWSLVAKTYYTYDGSGNLAQIDCYEDSIAPLREKLKYVNTYDASNRLHTVATSEFDGTSLTPYARDTFDYTGSLNYHSSWRETRWDGVNHFWAPISYMSKHINASLLPDTVYNMSFDSLSNSWKPQNRDVINYDTLHNPVTINEYSYSGSVYLASPGIITKYYYELYAGAGVQNVIAQNDNAIIYPNPATDKIIISQLSISAPSVISVNLIKADGRLVQSLHTTWHNNNIEVPVTDLQPGVYVLIINDAKGNIIHQQKMIKQ